LNDIQFRDIETGDRRAARNQIDSETRLRQPVRNADGAIEVPHAEQVLHIEENAQPAHCAASAIASGSSSASAPLNRATSVPRPARLSNFALTCASPARPSRWRRSGSRISLTSASARAALFSGGT